MLDKEQVKVQLKLITQDAWRSDSPDVHSVNGMIEWIVRESFNRIWYPYFEELENRIEELENGKDGGLQKPERNTKTRAKVA